MPERLTDEDYARLAAAHALHPEPGVQRLDRVEPLKVCGVNEERSLAGHVLNVLSADDTECFRAALGREIYANDRLNTIVWINEERPEQSTVHHNDDPERTASERLRVAADDDRAQYEVPCKIRIGGSKALEDDRAAENSARDQEAAPISRDQRQIEFEEMLAALLEWAQDRDQGRD